MARRLRGGRLLTSSPDLVSARPAFHEPSMPRSRSGSRSCEQRAPSASTRRGCPGAAPAATNSSCPPETSTRSVPRGRRLGGRPNLGGRCGQARPPSPHGRTWSRNGGALSRVPDLGRKLGSARRPPAVPFSPSRRTAHHRSEPYTWRSRGSLLPLPERPHLGGCHLRRLHRREPATVVIGERPGGGRGSGVGERRLGQPSRIFVRRSLR
jgi:hypothetical protein